MMNRIPFPDPSPELDDRVDALKSLNCLSLDDNYVEGSPESIRSGKTNSNSSLARFPI
jgi:hypothetical protein